MRKSTRLMEACSSRCVVAGLLASLVFLSTLGSGCIYVEAPDPNTPPSLTYIDAYAGWDSYYQQCFWEFYAWAEDWDGCHDVRSVSVDVIDLTYGDVVETFYLASDGCVDTYTQQFSDTIYYQYAGWADCNYPEFYGFDFYATDSEGEWDYAAM